MTNFTAADHNYMTRMSAARSTSSLNPTTGWPRFLGLYSAMVHISQADVVTILGIDDTGKIIAIPYYKQGRTQPTYYLPTASVTAKLSPEQAAKSELQRTTGFVASRLELLGRLLVEIDQRVATNYLYLAPQITLPIDAVRTTRTTAAPCHLALDGLSDSLESGAFPEEVHAVAITRALKKLKAAASDNAPCVELANPGQ